MASIGKADGSVIVKSVMDTGGITKGIQNIKGQIGGLGQTVGKLGLLIAGAFGVKSLISFGKACIDLGSDLDEVQNVVDVTFGSMSGIIDDFANNAATQFGLSQLQAKQFTSTLGAMYKSMGFTEKSAAGMSMEMTKLAADMASFYNLDAETAFQKIRSGISGETEPLKQLGINLSEANLEEFRLAQGIETAYSKMDQQSKALLRYNYLLSVTSDAQGDFARTSGSWANQVKVLKLQFDSIKADLGQGFIAIFTPVLQVINKVLAAIARLASSFKAFTALITGKKATSGGGGGSMAQIVDDTANSTATLADATKDSAKATKAATKANRKYLSGLDEIRTYTEAASDSAGDSAGKKASTAGTSAGAVPMPEFDFGQLETGGTVVDKLAEKMAKLFTDIQTAAQPTVQALQNLWNNGLKRLGEFSAGALYDFYKGFLVPVGDWVLGKGLPDLVNAINDGLMEADFETLSIALAGLWDALAPFAISVGEGLINFYKEFMIPIAKWTIGEGLPTLITALKDGLAKIDLTKINDALSTLWNALTPFAINVGEGLLWFFSNVLVPLGTWVANEVVPRFLQTLASILNILNTAINAAKPYFQWFWDNVLTPIVNWTAGAFLEIWDSILQVLNDFGNWCKENPEIIGAVTAAIVAFFAAMQVKSLITGIGALIAAIGPIPALIAGLVVAGVYLYTHWDEVKEKVIAIWNLVKAKAVQIWNGLKLWLIQTWEAIKTKAGNAFNAIKETISTIWTGVKTAASKTWTTIKTLLISLWNGIKTKAVNAFEAIKTTISTAWTNMKTAATNTWNNIKNLIVSKWTALKTSAATKFEEIKKGIGDKWTEIRVAAVDKWGEIKDKITGKWETLKKACFGENGAFSWIKDKIGDVWETITSVASGKWDSIKETITGVWDNLKESAIGESGIFTLIESTIGGIWDTISSTASTAWEGIKTVITGFWDDLKNVVTGEESPFTLISNTISNTWQAVSDSITEFWDGATGIYTTLTDFFFSIADAITGEGGLADSIKNGISGAFESLVDLIKTPINAIIGAINGMISGIVNGINAVISTLNKLSFTLPSWSVLPSDIRGQSFGLHIPQIYSYPVIPYLAKGAVIPPKAPFMAMLGDQRNGTNLEAPESLIRQIMREEIGDQNISVTLQLDGKTVWESVLKQARRQQMASGVNPFEMV